MNISKTFSIAAIIISLSAATAFADPDPSTSNGSSVITESKQYDKKNREQQREEFNKDPVKALESRKARIQSLLNEGKITKQKADEKTARIDSKIKEIQIFNKLTLQQKKDKLINNRKESVERRVKEGKLDRSKADTIIKDYIEKVNKWDGNGYPKFHLERSKDKCKNNQN